MITRRPARFGKKLKLFTHTFIFVSFGVFFFAIYKNISNRADTHERRRAQYKSLKVSSYTAFRGIQSKHCTPSHRSINSDCSRRSFRCRWTLRARLAQTAPNTANPNLVNRMRGSVPNMRGRIHFNLFDILISSLKLCTEHKYLVKSDTLTPLTLEVQWRFHGVHMSCKQNMDLI